MNLIYEYYITYHHSNDETSKSGFGYSYIKSDYKLDSCQNIENMSKYIKEINNLKSIVITNFILINTLDNSMGLK